MTTEQKIRQHVYTYAKKISNEVGEHLNKKFDPNALDLIAELTFKKLCLYAGDLEAFQKHAKRSTINMDDVKLLVRRNESLKKMINERAQFILETKPPEPAPPAKRKRKATNSTS